MVHDVSKDKMPGVDQSPTATPSPVRHNWKSQIGGNLIEYALLAALITVACFAAAQSMSAAQSAKIGAAAQSLGAAN